MYSRCGDVYASGKHVHRDDDYGRRTVAQLSNAFKRPKGTVCDLLDKRLTTPEYIMANAHKLIGVRNLRDIKNGDAAASQGRCCIALLGIWNWRGTNDQNGRTLDATVHAILCLRCAYEWSH
jgi:hypothetical protein